MHREANAALEAVQAGVETPTQLDQTLLAVVGILETLRKEPDIASWIGRGSLLNLPSSGPSREASAVTEPEVARLTSWWEQPGTMEFWIREGRAILQKLEIDVIV
jgi:hypothetical protein